MRLARVAEVAAQFRGVTFSKADAISEARDGYVPVLTASNIQDGRLVTDELTYVPTSKVSARQRVQANDVVVCASSGSLSVVGKAARSNGAFDGGFGAFLKVLRPGPEVDPGYFAHFFQTPSYRRKVSALAAGANINNLKNEHLNELEIPLPPLPEQRRIAAILDHADAVRAKRRQVLACLDSLAQSTFYAMFGDPVASELWPKTRLGDVARIVRGASPRPAGDPRYFGGSIPWLKIADVTAVAGPVVRRIKEGVTQAGKDKSVLLPPRTLILTNSATVGIPKIIEPATCIHDGFLAFLDIAGSVDQRWLLTALELLRPRMIALAPEGTQKNLNGPIVKALELGIPPIEQQREFSQRAAAIETRRPDVDRARAADDELFASLQSRAFRGEL